MSLNSSSAHIDSLVILLKVEPFLVFQKLVCYTVSLLLPPYPPLDLYLRLSCCQGSAYSVPLLAPAILKESHDPCTDSDRSPEGMPFQHFIEVVPRLHCHCKHLLSKLSFCFRFFVRLCHYVSRPLLWLGQPLWSRQPHITQLICLAAPASYVGWVVFGVDMSPFNVIFVVDLADSVGHKLFVSTSPLDPVECDSTVTPPMD